jgi:hypothetical protein
MKFVMVMIICFGVDCEAVFDKNTTYPSYNECSSRAIATVNYMRNMFPQSAGQVHCWDEKQIATFEKYLKDGGKPTIDHDLLPKELKQDA